MLANVIALLAVLSAASKLEFLPMNVIVISLRSENGDRSGGWQNGVLLSRREVVSAQLRKNGTVVGFGVGDFVYVVSSVGDVTGVEGFVDGWKRGVICGGGLGEGCVKRVIREMTKGSVAKGGRVELSGPNPKKGRVVKLVLEEEAYGENGEFYTGDLLKSWARMRMQGWQKWGLESISQVKTDCGTSTSYYVCAVGNVQDQAHATGSPLICDINGKEMVCGIFLLTKIVNQLSINYFLKIDKYNDSLGFSEQPGGNVAETTATNPPSSTPLPSTTSTTTPSTSSTTARPTSISTTNVMTLGYFLRPSTPAALNKRDTPGSRPSKWPQIAIVISLTIRKNKSGRTSREGRWHFGVLAGRNWVLTTGDHAPFQNMTFLSTNLVSAPKDVIVFTVVNFTTPKLFIAYVTTWSNFKDLCSGNMQLCTLNTLRALNAQAHVSTAWIHLHPLAGSNPFFHSIILLYLDDPPNPTPVTLPIHLEHIPTFESPRMATLTDDLVFTETPIHISPYYQIAAFNQFYVSLTDSSFTSLHHLGAPFSCRIDNQTKICGLYLTSLEEGVGAVARLDPYKDWIETTCAQIGDEASYEDESYRKVLPPEKPPKRTLHFARKSSQASTKAFLTHLCFFAAILQ